MFGMSGTHDVKLCEVRRFVGAIPTVYCVIIHAKLHSVTLGEN